MKNRLKQMVPTAMFISGLTFIVASIVIIAIYFNSTAPFYDQRYTPTDFYNAKVVEVYTGDSMLVDVELGFDMKLYSVSVRLDHIDAPEITDPMGEMSKDYLTEQVKEEQVVLKVLEQDEFGRWKAEVYENGRYINEELVERDLAKPHYE